MRNDCEIEVVNVCCYCNPFQSNGRHVRKCTTSKWVGGREWLLERIIKGTTKCENIPSNCAAYSMFTLCSISIISLKPAKSGFYLDSALALVFTSPLKDQGRSSSAVGSGIWARFPCTSFSFICFLYCTSQRKADGSCQTHQSDTT